MTRIKICGLTRVDDAVACARLGADFIGLVFVASSPRNVDVTRAAAIARAVRNERPVSVVGVFRDAGQAEVVSIAREVALDFVQLHGASDDTTIRAIGVPVIKAYSVDGALPDVSAHQSAAWSLFDGHSSGSGRVFDWSVLDDRVRTRPFLLAGGLSPDNVGEAIRRVRPDAVDVSTGVESTPGIKDPEKVRAFIEKVRAA